MNFHSNKLACAGLFLSLGFTAVADNNIYNNAALHNGSYMQALDGVTIGNEISLPPNTLTLTNFSFEYYAPVTPSLNSYVEVKFYLNNGPKVGGYPTPGTKIYDSGLYIANAAGVLPSGANDLSYSSSDLYSSTLPLALNLPAGYFLPSELTFTITFANLSGKTIDLPLANNYSGVSYGDYWLYNNVSSSWSLLTNSVAANFIVNFQGVPEPSVLGLGAIGGIMLLGVRKLIKKA
jgi:hypothetical protein